MYLMILYANGIEINFYDRLYNYNGLTTPASYFTYQLCSSMLLFFYFIFFSYFCLTRHSRLSHNDINYIK